jgi:beta-N-acetylhexosaminidase
VRSGAAGRFVFGISGTALTAAERSFLSKQNPFGVVLLSRNLESGPQAARLIADIRSVESPPPLLFVDQEGGTVDRIGPILGQRFPSASRCAEKGTDRVHECAYLMGRAARLLGFDVDFAPVLDLAQPGTGAVVLEGRTFGFHSEDVVLSGMVFLHGLARAGIASCVKHFPGLGRGAVDSHRSLPVVDAHDVDLMVTDVAPFTKLAGRADGVMVGHAAYPGLTGDRTPASLSPGIYGMLRGAVGFGGLVYSDDLEMGALEGPIPDRAARAVTAGCDVLVVSKTFEAYEEAIARVSPIDDGDPVRAKRLETLRRRCLEAPRPSFSLGAWQNLAGEVERFLELLEKPREKREEGDR